MRAPDRRKSMYQSGSQLALIRAPDHWTFMFIVGSVSSDLSYRSQEVYVSIAEVYVSIAGGLCVDPRKFMCRSQEVYVSIAASLCRSQEVYMSIAEVSVSIAGSLCVDRRVSEL